MKKIYNIIINIFLIFVILVCILPFLYMILMSTKSTINAYDISFNIADMSLAHYQRIFSDPTFIRYFLNSVFIAIAGVLLTLFTSCTAGYAFAKLKFKGRDKIFFLLLLKSFYVKSILTHGLEKFQQRKMKLLKLRQKKLTQPSKLLSLEKRYS